MNENVKFLLFYILFFGGFFVLVMGVMSIPEDEPVAFIEQ